MFGSSENAGRNKHVKFRGEDYNVQLQLNLKDASQIHKQTLTVNSRNIRIAISIENGQTICSIILKN